jgi:hypothetical protein
MCTKNELLSGCDRFYCGWCEKCPFLWPPIEEETKCLKIYRKFPQYSTIFRVHTYCHCHIHIYMRPQMNIFSSPTAAVVGGRFEAQNFSFSLCLCAKLFPLSHFHFLSLSLALTIAIYSLTHSLILSLYSYFSHLIMFYLLVCSAMCCYCA